MEASAQNKRRTNKTSENAPERLQQIAKDIINMNQIERANATATSLTTDTNNEVTDSRVIQSWREHVAS